MISNRIGWVNCTQISAQKWPLKQHITGSTATSVHADEGTGNTDEKYYFKLPISCSSVLLDARSPRVGWFDRFWGQPLRIRRSFALILLSCANAVFNMFTEVVGRRSRNYICMESVHIHDRREGQTYLHFSYTCERIQQVISMFVSWSVLRPCNCDCVCLVHLKRAILLFDETIIS
jgi:hypothetical protein